MVHTAEIRVRWSELDPYHHVNHAVYLTYFESARIEALEEIGFGMDRLKADGRQIVVTDLAVRFLVPATAGELLEVETAVAEVRRASTVWRQRILGEGTPYVTAVLTGAITDLEGRPRRVPEAFAVALGTLSGNQRPPG